MNTLNICPACDGTGYALYWHFEEGCTTEAVCAQCDGLGRTKPVDYVRNEAPADKTVWGRDK